MMYRAFTWLVLERGVDPENEAAVADLAKSVKVEVTASLPNSEESGRVLVDGEDATAYLVRPDVEAAVSLVSRLPVVREAMVRLQREVAEGDEIVVAGRDIGTVVLPDADLKILSRGFAPRTGPPPLRAGAASWSGDNPQERPRRTRTSRRHR